MILAGDIGGTNTRLAFFESPGDELVCREAETFSSQDFGSLTQVIDHFLNGRGISIDAACFGVAGPVIEGRCETTNLPWIVETAALQQVTGTACLALLNDLEATAYSLGELQPDDICELQAGTPGGEGNRAVIAAGTGLGEAGMFWNGRRYLPFASEGGHADFAARDDLEIDLLRYLIRQFGHASWERVVSGPGLVTVYEFLHERNPGQTSEAVAAEMQSADPAAVISKAAMENRCATCAAALQTFVSLYGSEAGNLALKLMARGGLYVAGGIAPKILGELRKPAFLQSILAKGRFQSLLKTIPVRIVTTDRAALLGAAHFARLLHCGEDGFPLNGPPLES